MSDFKAKMHQNRYWLGLCLIPRWGSLQHSPRPLAGFEGPTSKGGEGKGEGREEKRGEGREEKGRERRPFWYVAEEAFCLKSPPVHSLV